jgi:hypothetical protein
MQTKLRHFVRKGTKIVDRRMKRRMDTTTTDNDPLYLLQQALLIPSCSDPLVSISSKEHEASSSSNSSSESLCGGLVATPTVAVWSSNSFMKTSFSWTKIWSPLLRRPNSCNENTITPSSEVEAVAPNRRIISPHRPFNSGSETPFVSSMGINNETDDDFDDDDDADDVIDTNDASLDWYFWSFLIHERFYLTQRVACMRWMVLVMSFTLWVVGIYAFVELLKCTAESTDIAASVRQQSRQFNSPSELARAAMIRAYSSNITTNNGGNIVNPEWPIIVATN